MSYLSPVYRSLRKHRIKRIISFYSEYRALRSYLNLAEGCHIINESTKTR